MKRYACRFCIALYGLKGRDVPALPATADEAAAHVLREHRFPGRTAQEVLYEQGFSENKRTAARIIQRMGAVIVVHMQDQPNV